MRTLFSAGGIEQSLTNFDPYGQVLEQVSGQTAHLGFTGALTDESGFDYLNARTYDPAIGNFTSADPLEGTAANPGSFNKYGYVQGDPVNATDPSGKVVDQVCTNFLTSEAVGVPLNEDGTETTLSNFCALDSLRVEFSPDPGLLNFAEGLAAGAMDISSEKLLVLTRNEIDDDAAQANIDPLILITNENREWSNRWFKIINEIGPEYDAWWKLAHGDPSLGIAEVKVSTAVTTICGHQNLFSGDITDNVCGKSPNLYSFGKQLVNDPHLDLRISALYLGDLQSDLNAELKHLGVYDQVTNDQFRILLLSSYVQGWTNNIDTGIYQLLEGAAPNGQNGIIKEINLIVNQYQTSNKN